MYIAEGSLGHDVCIAIYYNLIVHVKIERIKLNLLQSSFSHSLTLSVRINTTNASRRFWVNIPLGNITSYPVLRIMSLEFLPDFILLYCTQYAVLNTFFADHILFLLFYTSSGFLFIVNHVPHAFNLIVTIVLWVFFQVNSF